MLGDPGSSWAVSIAAGALDIARVPGGERAVIAHDETGVLSIIDLNSRLVEAETTLSIPPPCLVRVDNAGNLAIVAGREPQGDWSISVVDPATRTELRSFGTSCMSVGTNYGALDGRSHFTSYKGVEFSGDGQTALLINRVLPGVSTYDVATGQWIAEGIPGALLRIQVQGASSQVTHRVPENFNEAEEMIVSPEGASVVYRNSTSSQLKVSIRRNSHR